MAILLLTLVDSLFVVFAGAVVAVISLDPLKKCTAAAARGDVVGAERLIVGARQHCVLEWRPMLWFHVESFPFGSHYFAGKALAVAERAYVPRHAPRPHPFAAPPTPRAKKGVQLGPQPPPTPLLFCTREGLAERRPVKCAISARTVLCSGKTSETRRGGR